jgi:Glyoxalase/Bleomycin resistance protein/Dioxygenase superfamily
MPPAASSSEWTPASSPLYRDRSMSLVSFGQPDDGIVQMAYVVPDIRQAIDQWVKNLKVGPWFLLEGFAGVEARYRGQPSRVEISLAMSFAGHMNVELIQQTTPGPSVYQETVDQRGYGFHHFGVATWHFDDELARHRALGHEVALLLKVPSGGRVAYLDTHGDTPGMVELIELGEDFEATFNRFYRASIGWDGSDPVRPFL